MQRSQSLCAESLFLADSRVSQQGSAADASAQRSSVAQSRGGEGETAEGERGIWREREGSKKRKQTLPPSLALFCTLHSSLAMDLKS